MLRITNDNFNEVFEAVAEAYKNSMYNDYCFSSGEVRREIEASNELDRLCKKLEELNVDFKTYMYPIFKKCGVPINENYDSNIEAKEFPNSLNLEISCRTLEMLFCEKDKHFIVEGCEPATKSDYFIQIQDNARFAYQQWDITTDAIEELKKTKKIKNILEKSNPFTLNKKLVSIGVIRDLFSDDEIDCSSILLKYEDKGEDLFICGAIGGFYEDIAIANSEKLIDVIPIYDISTNTHFRTLNKEVKVSVSNETGLDSVIESTVMKYNKVTKFINYMSEYETKLVNLA